MVKAKIDKRILSRVRQKERTFIKSISLISAGIGILYVSGFIWRCSYYQALGIPASMVEVQFPMVLIPKIHITLFLSQVILTFLAFSYHEFYKREKRARRAKLMGIAEPLDIIVDYGIKQHLKSNSPKKTNQVVLYDFLHEYIARPEHKESDWKFDIKEFEKFEKEALPLFTDIPPEIRGSFTQYELQLLIMDSDQRSEAIRDSLGSYPEGSKLFERLSLWCVYGWIILIVLMAIFWSHGALKPLIYAALGVGVGFALEKLARSEDRFQFWHMIWISVFLLFALNHFDGSITARADLSNDRLPIATFSKRNGQEEKGLLIASFSDCYFIVPLDANDVFRRIKIEKDEVRSISFTRLSWIRKSIEHNEQYLKALIQKNEDILERRKDPNSGS